MCAGVYAACLVGVGCGVRVVYALVHGYVYTWACVWYVRVNT